MGKSKIPLFSELAQFYRTQLLEDIIPFWLRYGIDWDLGGIFTAIGDDGAVQSTDKYMWSNARALYTFSALYNEIEQNEKWLEVAQRIYDFCITHGRTPDGRWRFLVDRTGKPIEDEKAIQVDAFAIMGLSEYSRATGSEQAVEIAMETFRSTRNRLSRPGSYGTHPYPIPDGMKAHRDHFQFAFAYYELWRIAQSDEVLYEAIRHSDEVMDNFCQPGMRVLLEYVSQDNRCIDTPVGRTMVPGHAIESMWFLMHIFRHFDDRNRLLQTTEVVKWAIEKGWDEQYGGILLGIDVGGKSDPYWKHWEKKLWWVFCEAIYALLLSYEITGDNWFLDWHRRVHDWAFQHFPNRQHGEWTQKLGRDGAVSNEVVALPVKDPFHLPRALIRAIKILERLAGGD